VTAFYLVKLRDLTTISTGSKTLDALLGGGIRSGLITDVYGESGSGKSQLCFTAAVNCVRNNGRVLFVDTAGTFRPERIMEIGGSSDVLEEITYLRALLTGDQINAIQKIAELNPQLVIVDTLTGLFSAEYSGPSRHLAVMKHLRNLAMAAMTCRCAVLITNMIRQVPAVVVDQAGRNIAQVVIPAQQREYLGSSVSIYSHIKLKLEIIDPKNSRFRARLIQPPKADAAEFGVSAIGITDFA
jgi:RecA/RadA recombinase